MRSRVNLNGQSGSGDTPLLYAAGFGAYDIVYQLLEAGADYRIKDNYGSDLAYVAIERTVPPNSEMARYREKVLKFLAKKGVDLEPARKKVAEELTRKDGLDAGAKRGAWNSTPRRYAKA